MRNVGSCSVSVLRKKLHITCSSKDTMVSMAVSNLTYLANLRPKLALVHGISTIRVLILTDGRGGLQSQCPSLNISQDTGQNYAEQGTRGWNGRENQPHDERSHSLPKSNEPQMQRSEWLGSTIVDALSSSCCWRYAAFVQSTCLMI